MVALGAAACLANQDWANRSIKNSVLGSVECAVPASLLIKSVVLFYAPHVDVHDPVSTSQPSSNVHGCLTGLDMQVMALLMR